MAISHKDFSSNGTLPPAPQFDRRWWNEKTDVASAITGVLAVLEMTQRARNQMYERSARLYGNLGLMAANKPENNRAVAARAVPADRITYNLIQSAVDTVVAKIAKNRPKPLFLTSKGDYKIQRRAKKLNDFVDGIFYENDAYAQGTMIFRDGAVFGDGFTHVFPYYGRVKHERVLASELWIDEIESLYGEPRQLHREKNVDRDVVLEMFPKCRKQILAATVKDLKGFAEPRIVSDVITVRESWHLRSGPEATDGRRVMSLLNGTLDDEEWDLDCFPFAKFQWCPRLFGFFGQGLPEQLMSTQLELNKMLMVAQKSFHLAGTFKIMAEVGSKIVPQQFNNDIGTILYYVGQQPQYVVPPVLPPGFWERVQSLKADGFELAGVSMLSAASKKPDGLNSGKALREYNDIESDRFMTIGQAFERYFLDLSKIDIAVAKQIYEDQGEYKVTVPGRRFIDTIDWKDIDLENDQYVMKCYPVSSLPNDPAGRLQTVQEYAQAGYLAPRQARKLLDFPDVEQEESLSNAQENWISKILDAVVDAETLEEAIAAYQPPEGFDDLQLAKQMFLEYYAQGKCNGLEEEKLDLLRKFNSQIDVLSGTAASANQPPPGAGTPQANPQATPTSDLLPNVPGGAPA